MLTCEITINYEFMTINLIIYTYIYIIFNLKITYVLISIIISIYLRYDIPTYYTLVSIYFLNL